MFLRRVTLPPVGLTWSRALTCRPLPASHIPGLARRKACSSAAPRRKLHASSVLPCEGAADPEAVAASPIIPAWLDIEPAVVQDILGEVTMKKFQFRTLVGEVLYLERHGFPMPEEKVTREQLETLMSMRTRKCRVLYVHALADPVNRRHDPEEVVKMDREG